MAELKQITKDEAYNACAPDDFPAMMEVERYSHRSTAFDKIISATHDHFWDPLDTKYIDFSEPFDMENERLLPDEFFLELRLPCFQKLTEQEKTRFANQSARWMLSSRKKFWKHLMAQGFQRKKLIYFWMPTLPWMQE